MKYQINKFFSIMRNEWFHSICAFCFVSSFMSNMLVFYFTGTHDLTIRRILSWTVIILALLIVGIKGIHIFALNKKSRKKMAVLFLIPLINGFLILIPMLQYGFSSYIARNLTSFLFYCLPMYFVAIYMLFTKKVKTIICKFKWLALISTPFFILSIMKFLKIIQTNDEWNRVGNLGYDVISSAGIMFLLFMFLEIYQLEEEKQPGKKFVLPTILSAIICAEIVVGGARIALILEVIIFTICILIFFIGKRAKKIFAFTIFFCIVLTVLMAMISSVYGGLNTERIGYTIDSKNTGHIWDALTSPESAQIVERIYEGETQLLYPSSSDLERIYLYRVALREANGSPLLGNGIMHYQLKYGSYPHNVILEMAADYGYIITGIILIFILYLMFSLWKTKDIISRGISLIWLAQSIELMISGNLYVMPCVIFGMVYSLGLKNQWRN